MSNDGQPFQLQAGSLSASLTVRDLEASERWYREVAGFAVERRYEREGTVQSVALRAGDIRILLNRDNGAKGAERVKGEGFSMMITTTQDIDEVARGMKSRGGTLLSEPADTPWGGRAFRVQDPDGFRYAISSPR